MRLPRFWRDSGRWNDAVVSTAVSVTLIAWGGLAWCVHRPGMYFAAVFLGPASGLFLGLAVIAILCRFFRDTQDDLPH
jgi:hypothetical protein